MNTIEKIKEENRLMNLIKERKLGLDKIIIRHLTFWIYEEDLKSQKTIDFIKKDEKQISKMINKDLDTLKTFMNAIESEKMILCDHCNKIFTIYWYEKRECKFCNSLITPENDF